MTTQQTGLDATAAALVLLVPLAVYLPRLLVGVVLAGWVGASLRRRLRRTHTERAPMPEGEPSAPPLKELPRDECLQLVASLSIGRIAVACHDQPPLVSR